MAAWITDSLTSAIAFASRLNPFARQSGSTALPGVFAHQLAVAAYMSSGMLRKVITIPAADRTQKWRDWQTDKDTIALLEKEEKRLGLRAKTKQAEILRGIGGGAMILITTGQHEQPLTPEQIAQGGLVAVNVVSRWEIQPLDFDRELTSSTFRQPRMFQVSSDGVQGRIHPSRVICFRGEPLPAGHAVSDEEAFWGDSRLCRVWREVENSDHAQTWFVELVKKAKLLRVGIPDLLDLVATEDGRTKLDQRIALIATGESSLNATVYRSGTGADDPGEKIDDYQINWTGIPAFMDALDQRIAAVADIPFTRLMGRSPAGMNATGEHDTNNWNDAVADGQENETRPCLEALDPFLTRSAGVAKPDEVTWRWAPLWTPSEKQEADTFKVFMEAIEKVQNTGAIPDRAFAEGFQNWLEEREYLPGLGAALEKLPEEERFGLNPDDDGTDPSELQAGKEGDPDLAPGGEDGSQAARRRAANDKADGK
jgi:phage-related protein (TIGR01555 family)